MTKALWVAWLLKVFLLRAKYDRRRPGLTAQPFLLARFFADAVNLRKRWRDSSLFTTRQVVSAPTQRSW
jgi:hypothetical protein